MESHLNKRKRIDRALALTQAIIFLKEERRNMLLNEKSELTGYVRPDDFMTAASIAFRTKRFNKFDRPLEHHEDNGTV